MRSIQSCHPCYLQGKRLHKLLWILLVFAILTYLPKVLKCEELEDPRRVRVLLILPNETREGGLVCGSGDIVNESVKIIETESRELLKGKYEISLEVLKQDTLNNEEYLKVANKEISDFSNKESATGIVGSFRLVQDNPDIFSFKVPFCAVPFGDFKKGEVDSNAGFFGISRTSTSVGTLIRKLGPDKVNVFVFSSPDFDRVNQSLLDRNALTSSSDELGKSVFVLRDDLSLKYVLDNTQVREKRIGILTGDPQLTLKFLIEAHKKDLISANVWISDTIPDIEQMRLLFNNDSRAVCEVMESVFIREPLKSQLNLPTAMKECNLVHNDVVGNANKTPVCVEYMTSVRECIVGFINDFICERDGLCGIVSLGSRKGVLPDDLLHMDSESKCNSLMESNPSREVYKDNKVRSLDATDFGDSERNYSKSSSGEDREDGNIEHAGNIGHDEHSGDVEPEYPGGRKPVLGLWESAVLIFIVSLVLIFYGFIAVLICRMNPRRASINCPKISLTILFGSAVHLLIILSFTWKCQIVSCLTFRILPIISGIIIFTGLLAKTLVILSVFSLKNYKKNINFPTTKLFVLSGTVVVGCIIYGALVEYPLLKKQVLPRKHPCSILYNTLGTELARFAMSLYSLGLKCALAVALYKSRRVHREFRQITSISLAIYNHIMYDWVNNYLFMGSLLTFKQICVYSLGLIFLSLVSTISIFFAWFTKRNALCRNPGNSVLSEDVDGMFAASRFAYNPVTRGPYKSHGSDSDISSVYKCYITTTGLWGLRGSRRQRVLLILDLQERMYMVQKIFTIDIRQDENEPPKEYVDTVGKSFYIRDVNIKIAHPKKKDGIPKVVLRNSQLISTTFEFDSMSEYKRFVETWNSYFKSHPEGTGASE